MLALGVAFLTVCVAISLGGPLSQFLDIPSLLFVFLGPILISLAIFNSAEVGRTFIAPFVKIEGDSMIRVTILKSLAGHSLSFGVIGSLISLINLLAHMDNPKTLAPSIAACLITTFYGLILGLFIYLPLAAHVEKE